MKAQGRQKISLEKVHKIALIVSGALISLFFFFKIVFG